MLIYGPIQRPRPYSDITEVDPLKVPFPQTVGWALHRGFRQQAWHPDYSTPLEPEMDWHTHMDAERRGIRMHH